ncbi:MAG: glycosyltransferase [Terrimicrobiaceae bacterium]
MTGPVRTIHFTWKDAHPPGSLFRPEWRRSWESVPGWSTRFWTDADISEFSRQHGLERVLDLCRSPVARCDAFRYFLLQKIGGLYVDLDFVNLSDLQWLDEIHSFACADQGDGFLCNAFLYAPFPDDAFFQEIGTALEESVAESNPVTATGPRFLTRYASGRPLRLISSESLYPIPWNDREAAAYACTLSPADLRQLYPRAHAVHLWAKSWFPPH